MDENIYLYWLGGWIILGFKIPALWDAGIFSMWGLVFSTGGAVVGVVLGQKLYQHFN